MPALSIAVIRNYQVDWVRTYGMADTQRRIPATNDTVFSAGSISKFANGLLAMVLVQDGKLALERPVSDFLIQWKIAGNEFTRATPPTLRMLLTHTAGTTQSAFFGFQPEQPLPSVLQSLQGAPPAENRPVVVNAAPGKEFRYSGGGVLITHQAAIDNGTGLRGTDRREGVPAPGDGMHNDAPTAARGL